MPNEPGQPRGQQQRGWNPHAAGTLIVPAVRDRDPESEPSALSPDSHLQF